MLPVDCVLFYIVLGDTTLTAHFDLEDTTLILDYILLLRENSLIARFI